jgi:pSer/pThr/pTyr-binding forkhead associated (FHA) protein
VLICPACEAENEEGATACAECGGALPDADSATFKTLHTRPSDLLPEAVAREEVKTLSLPNRTIVVLQIGEGLASFFARQQVIIGRRIPGSGGRLIDLSPHGAYELGVSKYHARIRLNQANYLEIADLASANGTFLNGVRLKPLDLYQFAEGDELRFARLVAHVSFEVE